MIRTPVVDVFGEGRYSYVLEGGGDLGEVPAEDVATFIHELVRVIARAAGYAINRPVKDTGRYEAIVKAASKVRIDSIATGSVVVTLLPSHHEVFRLGDNLGLDAETVSQRAMAISHEAAGPRAADYADVARQWVELSDRVGVGRQYRRVVVRAAGRDPVTIDAASKASLREIVATTLAGVEGDTVRGVLYEANFESLTAKLRNQKGDAVDVHFDLDDASAIKEALRNPATIAGRATYDRKTNRLLTIQLEELIQPVQTMADELWQHRPIRQVLKEKGIGPSRDPGDLHIDGVSDEEWDSFFEAIGIET
jgi:hypothetical protein